MTTRVTSVSTQGNQQHKQSTITLQLFNNKMETPLPRETTTESLEDGHGKDDNNNNHDNNDSTAMEPVANPQQASMTSQPSSSSLYHPHFHTLDENDLHHYSASLQQELRQALSAHEKQNALKVGVVLSSTSLMDPALRAMPSLISQCHLTAFCLLQEDDNDSPDSSVTRAKQWLSQHASGYPILERNYYHPLKHYGRHKHQTDEFANVHFYAGRSGYEEMVRQDDVHAIYMISSNDDAHALIGTAASKYQKSVLVSAAGSSRTELTQWQRWSSSDQCLVLDALLLSFPYRVQSFLETVQTNVLTPPKRLHVQLYARKPLSETSSSCIRSLAPYGILCALWLFDASVPTAVQILARSDEDATRTKHGLGLHVHTHGVIWFGNAQKLTLDLGYTVQGPTRQVLQVHTADQYATMNDFLWLWNDHEQNPRHCNLNSTFCLYEKSEKDVPPFGTPKLGHPFLSHVQVTGGDSLDVPGGPPLHVMMWRRWAQLVRAVQPTPLSSKHGTVQGTDPILALQQRKDAERYSRHSLQLRYILDCLQESQQLGNIVVPLDKLPQ